MWAERLSGRPVSRLDDQPDENMVVLVMMIFVLNKSLWKRVPMRESEIGQRPCTVDCRTILQDLVHRNSAIAFFQIVFQEKKF